MGYEIKLFIGEESNHPRLEGFSRDKDDVFRRAYTDDHTDDYHGYLSDGNTKIKLDKPETFAVWMEVIAMVGLCKAGYDSKIHAMCGKENSYHYNVFFYVGGNDEILDDNYSELMRVYTAQEVLNSLIEDDKEFPYRRFKIAIALLQSVIKEFKNPIVAMFGH